MIPAMLTLCAACIAIGYCFGRIRAEHLAERGKPLPWRDDVEPIVWMVEIYVYYRLYKFNCGTLVSVRRGLWGEWYVSAYTTETTLHDTEDKHGPTTTRGLHAALCSRGLPSPWKWEEA